MKNGRLYYATMAACLVASALLIATPREDDQERAGAWVAGDFHTHTYLTDGSHTEADVLAHAFGGSYATASGTVRVPGFGLDWMANSEHGGLGARNPFGLSWTAPSIQPPTVFLGNPYPAPNMYRWQSLRDYSFPIIEAARRVYRNNVIVQGVEWNVPRHEHASVGFVTDEPVSVASFEYTCDASDRDTSWGTPKMNATHLDAVACVQALQNSRRTRLSSYMLLNHPSRKLLYSVAAIRDLNNAAPDVAFGIEGMPGHQKESFRGGYSNGPYTDPNGNDITYKARTYGGADYMLAHVGGLWDSLLSEGRHFWVFANSDFHSSAADADFYPGEYAKSYTFANCRHEDGRREDGRHEDGDNERDGRPCWSAADVVNGMRSGNSFAVHGDLIDGLDFTARSRDDVATMGQTLEVRRGASVRITIRFKSPQQNAVGDPASVVDHVDLIAGRVTGLIPKTLPDGTPNPAYATDTNPTTEVAARFDASSLRRDGDWYVATYVLRDVHENLYFRLRGTNLAVNTINETDGQGNPLVDDLMGSNDASKARADLWFYSNAIFVRVAH
jgi:hypothetical protein